MTPLGPRHEAIARLRRLSGRRSARHDAGSFVIDGPILCGEALTSGIGLVEVFVDEDAAGELPRALLDGPHTVHVVRSGVLAKAASTVTSQGVCAVAPIPEPVALGSAPGLVLVLVGVGDPGNAGTLVRVAEAAGASAVALAGDAVDVWNPKCVRAAAGSLFRVPLVRFGEADVIAECHRHGFRVLAAAGDAAGVAPESLDLTGSNVLLLGNEAHGLPTALVERCDDIVSIPMSGAVESLNVAMAGCVVAFEAARQRRTGTQTNPSSSGRSVRPGG